MTVYARAPNIIATEVGDELVALDVHSGDCFALNEVAASVWKGLSEPRSFDELRDTMLGEYDVSVDECTNDLQDLLDDLVGKGLLEKSA